MLWVPHRPHPGGHSALPARRRGVPTLECPRAPRGGRKSSCLVPRLPPKRPKSSVQSTGNNPHPPSPGGSSIHVHHQPHPSPPVPIPPWACPCTVGWQWRWVGGLVGGWEVGKQHGERGGNHLVAPHHRVRTERTAFCPTPGGSVELMQEDRPIYLGAGPLRHACSRQFYPQC